MKLKIFTLGLLAALAVTSTNSEAFDRRRAEIKAAQEAPALKQQVAEGNAAAANLDVGVGGAHHDDPVAAAQDIHNRIGAHSAPGAGDTTNERLTDLHNTLGHAVGGAAHHANQRAETAVALLEPGASIHDGINHIIALLGAGGGADIHAKAAAIQALVQPAQPVLTGIGNVNGLIHAGGPADAHAKIVLVNGLLGVAGTADAHGKIGAINGILGAVHNAATARGVGGVAAANVEAKLTAILARLKAGLAATALAGVHVHAVAATKTTNTAAGAVVAGDEGAAAAAANIEDFLAEIGW